jgi:arginyl-tRNA synthetase
MQDLVKKRLAQIIEGATAVPGGDVELSLIYDNIEPCPQPELGQYAFKTFLLAKRLATNPKELADRLSQVLSDHDDIASVKQAGPYINIVLKSGVVGNDVATMIDGKKVRIVEATTPHRYMVEHSQPNTHKELHIGHTRNSVLGDSICRMLRHAGHHVYAENYHGDEGAHVAKALWYIDAFKQEPAPGQDKGTWLGKMYVAATTAQTEATGDDAERIKGEISNVLHQIEKKEGHFYEQWKETREWSLALFREVYKWLGVTFDGDRCESDVSDESFKVVDEYLKKGVFIKSEGAIGCDLSDDNLGFCMLLKSDGRGLYATKDLALALTRFRTERPDTCIYVVDNRQSHHFKQVFATLRKMGFKEADRCFHMAYEMVETKDGAMSSRKGNIVPILELIDSLQDRAYQIVAQRYADSWSKEQITDTAQKIANAAVRYGMLKVDPESKIIFDMDSWLTLEGNTGPYLQYVYARMSSLQRKSEEAQNIDVKNVDWSALTNTSEQSLLAHMGNFNEALQISCEKLKPHSFTQYVYDLARKFNAFYAESPILNETDDATRQARLALVKIASYYLGTGLDLLGIQRIEQM